MSYAVHLYHPDVKAAMDSGRDFDDVPLTEIPEVDRQKFRRLLEGYDYSLEHESDECIQYGHTNKEWGIEVCIFPGQIAFAVPYWNEAETAIFEAIMAASEIAHDVSLKVFLPADGEWQEFDDC